MEKEPIGMKVKDFWTKFSRVSKQKVVQWKKPLIVFSIVTIMGVTSFFVYQSGFSYQVQLNGENIGIVKEVTTIEEALKIVENDIAQKHGENAYFAKDIDMKKVRVNKEDLVDSKKLGEVISQNLEVLKPASIIVVDGQEELVVTSTKDAQEILEEVKKPYIEVDSEKDTEVLEVSFNQEVQIISKDMPADAVLSKEEALAALSEKNDKMQTYRVAQGDSAWNISRSFNMGIRTLEQANPDKDIEKLKPGEEINLVVPQSLLEVVTVERHKDTADINFKVEEKKDSSLYKGEKKVKEEGKKGEKEITAEITFINGVESKKTIVEEKVLQEPKNKVVLVGTKERPRAAVSTQSSRKKGNKNSVSSNRPAPTYNGNLGSAIVSTARHYLGTPYRSGGSTPAGFDCSGFTSYIYRQYGINIPRSSGAQGGFGARVSKSELKPGDIVVFPGHVGIYVGGNSFIHSPSPGKSIQITSLNNAYFKNRFISGRRPY
ncbi:NlpC/P60 family protein [Irregularibacter muris]|uniref:NlpC/P60 family protein n=1 Tax=Irregularibacter muris TaxID=1796619 RepID=A0AAE3HDX8_9FIRM|nr:C40 family peptidase [Irregularibacter muris]MCR1897654.1 NlpC/P60 family protein [Irregularibacter muris]